MKGVLIFLALAAPAIAQESATTRQAPGTYVGVGSCVTSGCHGAIHPLRTSRVLHNEYYTWLSDDRHAQAYNLLFNDRSASIARNVRLERKPYQEAICLECHSTNVAPRLVSGHIDAEDGVQCEACHGPAGGWRAEHVQPDWTHAQSIERGMIDLRRLPTRAAVCLSCHLGDATREVDHQLIASGHPFLAFELDNYTATMPPHWRSNETDGARAWAVGQVIAFRNSLGNLARHARGGRWPEFSDLSCANCHHALSEGSWRQPRVWPERAGLPAWSPQRWGVLRLIVARAAPQSRSSLEEAVQRVATLVGRMNDPAGVAGAADQARALLDPIVSQVELLRWNERDIRAFMRALADEQEFVRRSDVQSAEQIALSLQSLAAVLTRHDPRLLRSAMMKSIDDLFAELQHRDAYDANRFAAGLQAVRRAVNE
jgi:hypothetical protein